MSPLEDAIVFAVKAHKGQVDKAGEPYILHLLRVMLSVDTEEERILAILHDIIEDTEYLYLDIEEVIGPNENILSALFVISRQKDEVYKDYIMRVKKNSLATQVKLADLEDNMSSKRSKNISPKLYQRYMDAYEYLTEGDT